MAKRAVKLTFDDKFFVLAFDHLLFDAFTARSFLAAFQKYRFSVFKVKLVFAELTLKVRILGRFHLVSQINFVYLEVKS